MPAKANREADMQHRIEELQAQLDAAKASIAARAQLREFIAKHPELTHADVSMVASEMRAPGRFNAGGKPPSPVIAAIGKAIKDARDVKGLDAKIAAKHIGVHIALDFGVGARRQCAWPRAPRLPSSACSASAWRRC